MIYSNIALIFISTNKKTMKTNEIFTKFNHSSRLKSLGFDEECFTHYSQDPFTKKRRMSPITSTIVLEESQLESDDWEDNFTGHTNSQNNRLNLPHVTAPTYQQAFDWCIKRLKEDYSLVQNKKGFEIQIMGIGQVHGDRDKCLEYLITELELEKYGK